jgi:drug/metabolite transporter (DMT)-like permease
MRSQSVGVGPADSLLIRYTPVAVVWILVLAMTGRWRIERSDWPRLLVASLIGLSAYAVASIYGFAYVPAGIGGLIYATQPLFISFLGVAVLGERLTLPFVFGVILAIAGTVLLLWDDLESEALNLSFLSGILLILLACFAWAIYTVLGKAIFQRYGSVSITAMSTIVATLPMFALASGSTIEAIHNMTPRQWLEVLFLTTCSTFVAVFAWNYASAKLPATTLGAFYYLVPVIAVLAGVLMLGETLSSSTIVGGICIILGVAIAEFGPRFRRNRLSRKRSDPSVGFLRNSLRRR